MNVPAVVPSLHLLFVQTLPGAGKPPTPSFVALLIILMGLFFAIFQLSFPIAAVETGNPIRMISRSWQLARHHYLRLLAFVVTVFIGLGLVVIATQFGLGSVIVLFLGKPEPGSLSALVLGLIAGVIGIVLLIRTELLDAIGIVLGFVGVVVGGVLMIPDVRDLTRSDVDIQMLAPPEDYRPPVTLRGGSGEIIRNPNKRT